MAAGAIRDGAYWAFISYCHKDAAFCRQLHKRLENYKLPKRLIKESSRTLPRQLTPIFRDIDEFRAAPDLSSEVRSALLASTTLVVVCSPAAAASPWVAKEIRAFRELCPERPMLSVLADGDPPMCFPSAIANNGEEAIEPLAADFRPGKDGAQFGLLKLVAGILNLDLDQLVRRDAQRRVRSVMAVTALALSAVLIMTVLTVMALTARTEAIQQRKEAEGLVKFMLTDLRQKLQDVGRLDIMTTVATRALQYCQNEHDGSRSPASIETCSEVLEEIGEIDLDLARYDDALSAFRRARAETRPLLHADPNDPERLFAQAQNQYGIAAVSYFRGDLSQAKHEFLAYKNMADRMVAVSPYRTKYQREIGFAEGNLCTVALAQHDTPGARDHCGRALNVMQATVSHPDIEYRTPKNQKSLRKALTEALADYSDAYRLSGDFREARAARERENKVLQPMLHAEPRDMDLRDTWAAMEHALATLDELQGKRESALGRLHQALAAVDRAVRHDPANASWLSLQRNLQQELRQLNKRGGSDARSSHVRKNDFVRGRR